VRRTTLTTKVVDAPCGKGKTSWAIQEMNAQVEKKNIFITPYLEEGERVQTDCSGLNFKTPSDKSKSKSAHLKDLLEAEHNIAGTHSLFTRIDSETLELIRMGGYRLFLDEVMNVVHQMNVSTSDLQMLENDGYLIIDRGTGKVTAAPKSDNYTGAFGELIDNAKSGRLVCFNNTFLLWQFPPEVFEAFDEVYVLTYLFDGQIQRCYFEYHDIPYEKHTVEGTRETGYSLAHYDPIDVDKELREWLKAGNLNVYDGRLNDIGKKGLSYSWYERHSKNKRVMKKVKDTTYNYFKNIVKGKAPDNMWTTYKVAEDVLKGSGYARGFVAHNARATNEYGHKKNLAYLVNRYLPPQMIQYFNEKGVAVNGDLFAVSELIQWLFRSALRNKEPVNLFLPSERMRYLLNQWLEGELI
jgi:hypothetical protein